MENFKIKNPNKLQELLNSGEWEKDPYYNDINLGQVNYLLDDETYYDAENDEICTI